MSIFNFWPSRETPEPTPQSGIASAMDAALARDRAGGRDPMDRASDTSYTSHIYSQAVTNYGVDPDTAAALVNGVVCDTSSPEYAAWYRTYYGSDSDGDYIY